MGWIRNIFFYGKWCSGRNTVYGIGVAGKKNSYVELIQTMSYYAYSIKCPIVIDKINSGNPFEEILAKSNWIF